MFLKCLSLIRFVEFILEAERDCVLTLSIGISILFVDTLFCAGLVDILFYALLVDTVLYPNHRYIVLYQTGRYIVLRAACINIVLSLTRRYIVLCPTRRYTVIMKLSESFVVLLWFCCIWNSLCSTEGSFDDGTQNLSGLNNTHTDTQSDTQFDNYFYTHLDTHPENMANNVSIGKFYIEQLRMSVSGVGPNPNHDLDSNPLLI